jgi:hypothetical protein
MGMIFWNLTLTTRNAKKAQITLSLFKLQELLLKSIDIKSLSRNCPLDGTIGVLHFMFVVQHLKLDF